ncbi:rhamnan synthesis F family protein [Falsiruegeria mediterranea]|nr:rhamnan synthesis F family protein [Falsiruegeria mediterranea]
MSRLLHQIRVVLRFLTPNTQTRRHVRLLKESGLFDRGFYIRSNPRLRRLFRLAPERHYALFGEPAGLCPNPSFSPRAYLYNNPDLQGGAARHPFLHYIECGQHEARTVLDTGAVAELPLPVIHPPSMHSSPPAPVAVALHLYYHDMWPEFATALEQQSFAFDLYVTATGAEAEVAPLRAQVQARFPQASVWAMPNHGRDIFPFLHLLSAGLFAPYRAICKLHSKKSPHRADGAVWRQNLVAGVLGPPDRTQTRLDAFLNDPQAGIWVADGQHYHGEDWWGCNRDLTRDILARAGLDPATGPLNFPAGAIYWVKPAVLAQLASLRLTASDFEPEQALVDGTTAHAVERTLGYLSRAAQMDIRESHDLDAPHVERSPFQRARINSLD